MFAVYLRFLEYKGMLYTQTPFGRCTSPPNNLDSQNYLSFWESCARIVGKKRRNGRNYLLGDYLRGYRQPVFLLHLGDIAESLC